MTLQSSRKIYVCAWALLLAAALALPSVGGAAQGAWTLESTLQQLDRAAKEFHGLSGDVERTKVTTAVNDRSTESGKVVVRRDDKMRLELTAPDPRTILRDGDHLSVYNPRIHRVEEYDLGKHRSLVDQFLLLGFGTPGESLKKSYLITLQGEETLGTQKVLRLELTPKSDDVRAQISKIWLWVDESSWLPAQQQFFETGSGDYLVIRYTNVTRNPRLADSLFKPHWPSGVSKVRPGD